MDDREENQALVAFTFMAPLSVGGLIGLLAVQNPATPGGLTTGALAVLVVGVLALGASFLHLGRPMRAYRAITKLSSSWLSREVALFGLFLLGLAAYALLPAVLGSAQPLVGVVAAIVGLVSVLTTGELYKLRSRPAWDHWSTSVLFAFGAVGAGVSLGLAAGQWSQSGGAGTGSSWIAAAVVASVGLLISAWLTWSRSARLRIGGVEAQRSWDLISGQYRWALVVRVAGSILAVAALAIGWWGVAWVPAAVGELADRVLFFYTAVPVSLPARSGVPVLALHHAAQGTRTE